MTTSSVNYGADTAITFDVSSLATSSTFLAGRESTQIDNTSNKFIDAIVTCRGGVTGHASTAPTVGQYIGLWIWGSDQSLATVAIDTLDGTDSNETLAHASVLNSLIPVATAVVTVATAGLKYYFMPFSVAQFFGGNMPKFWGLFLAHNHNGALAASQSGLWYYHGIKHDSA
jgi:hypothetical protein